MEDAGAGVKVADHGMVTAVSLVVTQLLQRRRGRRRGEQHEVRWRGTVLTELHQFPLCWPSSPALLSALRAEPDYCWSAAWLLQTLFTPARRNRKQRQACSALHHHNVSTALLLPPPYTPSQLPICLPLLLTFASLPE